MGKKIPLIQRLEARIEKTVTCWNWKGLVTYNGYGQYTLRIPGKGNKQTTRVAHRVVYEELVGAIPEGLVLDHLCLNRLCVNPAHLEPVTQQVNRQRTDVATRPTCIHGHFYAEQSASYTRKGARRCHECHRTAEALRRINLKERVAV